MHQSLKQILKILPIIFTFLVAILYRSIIIESIMKLSQLGLLTIFGVFILYSMNWILKGLKWKLLLNTQDFSILELTHIIVLGNFTSLFVPAKSGDLVRLRLAYSSTLSKSEIVASTLMDRIWDLLGIIFSLAILLLIFHPFEIINPNYFWLVLFLLLGGLAFTYLVLPRFKSIIEERSPDKIKPLTTNFLNGLIMTSSSSLPIIFILSITIWFIEGLVLIVIVLKFAQSLVWWPFIFAVLIANITKIFPLTPGGFVIYESSIGFVLSTLTAIGLETGIEYGILDSIFKNGYTILLGMISYYNWFIREDYSINNQISE